MCYNFHQRIDFPIEQYAHNERCECTKNTIDNHEVFILTPKLSDGSSDCCYIAITINDGNNSHHYDILEYLGKINYTYKENGLNEVANLQEVSKNIVLCVRKYLDLLQAQNDEKESSPNESEKPDTN